MKYYWVLFNLEFTKPEFVTMSLYSLQESRYWERHNFMGEINSNLTRLVEPWEHHETLEKERLLPLWT